MDNCIDITSITSCCRSARDMGKFVTHTQELNDTPVQKKELGAGDGGRGCLYPLYESAPGDCNEAWSIV